MWNRRRGALSWALCIQRGKKFRGQFKTAATYKNEKGKIEDRGIEEWRSQGNFSLSHQEVLFDKGEGVLEGSYKEYTLHLSSN